MRQKDLADIDGDLDGAEAFVTGSVIVVIQQYGEPSRAIAICYREGPVRLPGKFLLLIHTRISSFTPFVPVAFLGRGICQGPPPAGSMSQKEIMSAVKMSISLAANCRPLHILAPPPRYESVD